MTYQGNIAIKLCSETPQKVFLNLSRKLLVTLALLFLAQISAKKMSWMAHRPPLYNLGYCSCPLVKLSNTTNYIWVDQKPGLTWLSDKTKLCNCQNSWYRPPIPAISQSVLHSQIDRSTWKTEVCEC